MSKANESQTKWFNSLLSGRAGNLIHTKKVKDMGEDIGTIWVRAENICPTCGYVELIEYEKASQTHNRCDYCKTHNMTDLQTRLARRIDIMGSTLNISFPNIIQDLYEFIKEIEANGSN